ncbi:Polycomb protein suz12-B [Pleurostoma richardsiae]|uniref:Polycomb protein suz12-B n=1 Tax=Pleurostoma richardsiae TaxID=41990 RepID=A0AA38RWW3_9PEZI|nr:Polycomb protein suz12-B [Pleurostoma richardsiae]
MTSINRPRSKLPYLQRNWISGINHHSQGQAMGATLSNLNNPSDKISSLTTSADDDYCSRPAKRRRLFEGSPDSGLGQDIHAFSLPEEPGDLQRALRIEVLRIIHRDTSRVRFNTIFNGITATAVNKVTTIKARCKITISCQKAGETQVLHCDSQICTLKTYKNPVGPSHMARIYLPHPFTIPEDKILIERDDDDAFDLADTYTVSVELESAGYPNWPPTDLLGLTHDEDIFFKPSQAPRHWSLIAHLRDIFQRPVSRMTLGMRLKNGPRNESATDYLMEADVRWSTGFSETAVLRKPDKGVLPSITAIDPDAENIPRANGHLGDHQANGIPTNADVDGDLDGELNSLIDDVEEEAEGEITPSRSLRARGSKNYNLKLLSDKAQGKERRRRQKLEKTEKPIESHKVFYRLPAEHYSVTGYACCICHAMNQSLNQLRAHFFSHPQYRFLVDFKAARGVQISVSHCEDGPSSPLHSKIYQLGRPIGPLELDKYVEGDDSWVTSRYGPDNDLPQKPAHLKVHQKPLVRRKEQKIVIPSIKQPLFDPLSKALLEPGTELREYYPDETWLIQKHRDTIQDFFDVDPTEKEYMKEWDAFIIKRKISSDAYIPRAFSAFVREKATWLVGSIARVQEFGKHLSVLIARESLDEQTIQEALARIQEARSQKQSEQEPKESAKEAQYKSSKGCTICARPVRGPSLLICANPECKRPLYHDDCARPLAKIPVDGPDWRCNECCSK